MLPVFCKFSLMMAILTTVLSPVPFEKFVLNYRKSYSSPAEQIKRKSIYQVNTAPLTCQQCDGGPYADLTAEEFRCNILCHSEKLGLSSLQNPVQSDPKLIRVSASTTSSVTVQTIKPTYPNSLDWRDKGIITSVKTQGECGTCWSFATVGIAESMAIQKGLGFKTALYEIDFSEQFLLKCVPGSTCNGGYLESAIDFMISRGLPFEQQYPYLPFYNPPTICQETNVINVTSLQRISRYDQNDNEIIALLNDGPIAIAVDASIWQMYTGGVLTCRPSINVNHAVILIGYTPDYWIIKNQWGTGWGESGFIRVTRNKPYNCGIGSAIHALWGVRPLFIVCLAIIGLLL